jgi:hypothetical protein
LRRKVTLVLEGVPPHAWDAAVVEDLLGNSCAVEAVAPATKSRSDMSLFQLSAWASDLEAIPVARLLAIPEPVLSGGARAAPVSAVTGGPAGEAEIQTLQYLVLIHLVRVEEDAPEDPERVLGRGQDGRGDQDESGGDGGVGGRGARGRRVSRDLPWQRGFLIRDEGREECLSAAPPCAFPRWRRSWGRDGSCRGWPALHRLPFKLVWTVNNSGGCIRQLQLWR